MEILDASGLMGRAQNVGEKARVGQLYPSGAGGQGLLALDLIEVEPGGSTGTLRPDEERVLFVLSGTGEVRGSDSVAALVRANSVLFVGPREAHSLRNTGADKLRVLVATSLLARTGRALGLEGGQDDVASEPAVADKPQGQRVAESGPDPVVQQPRPEPDEEAPRADISSLMKRGSEIAASPKPERKSRAPEPQVAQSQEDTGTGDSEDEEEDGQSELMELAVVFDGGSRGNPGQGYGSFLVQSPGRRPVIKRVEFGDNYTNNQAEYDSLIASLQYIIERLTATNRAPGQVALDIKTDSDLVVNQVQGMYKVKDAGLKLRHTKAMELLEQFGAWMIAWHPREESVKLLGH